MGMYLWFGGFPGVSWAFYFIRKVFTSLRGIFA